MKKSKKRASADTLLAKVNGQKSPIRTDRNVRSEVPVMSDQIGHDQPFRSTSCVRFNKDSAVQDRDRAVEAATAASAGWLERREEAQWKSIGMSPAGSLDFQQAWKSIYEKASVGEQLSEIMERCIQVCQDSGIKLPPPFFAAKRVAERGSTDNEHRLRPLEPFVRSSMDPNAPRIGNGELPMAEPFRR